MDKPNNGSRRAIFLFFSLYLEVTTGKSEAVALQLVAICNQVLHTGPSPRALEIILHVLLTFLFDFFTCICHQQTALVRPRILLSQPLCKKQDKQSTECVRAAEDSGGVEITWPKSKISWKVRRHTHTHTHTNLGNHVSTSSAHLGERVACWEHWGGVRRRLRVFLSIWLFYSWWSSSEHPQTWIWIIPVNISSMLHWSSGPRVSAESLNGNSWRALFFRSRWWLSCHSFCFSSSKADGKCSLHIKNGHQ